LEYTGEGFIFCLPDLRGDQQDTKAKEGFDEFFKKYYPNKDLFDILAAVEKFIKRFRAL
jgi:hypothetical protein